jgi:hypothetical protein
VTAEPQNWHKVEILTYVRQGSPTNPWPCGGHPSLMGLVGVTSAWLAGTTVLTSLELAQGSHHVTSSCIRS